MAGGKPRRRAANTNKSYSTPSYNPLVSNMPCPVGSSIQPATSSADVQWKASTSELFPLMAAPRPVSTSPRHSRTCCSRMPDQIRPT
eukprot:5174910-Pyramimonas_sp.AAC.1